MTDWLAALWRTAAQLFRRDAATVATPSGEPPMTDTSVLSLSIADAGKLLEPLAQYAEADPNVVAALSDLKQAAASLKAAVPAVATSLADKLIGAGLDAIPVAGPLLASLAAPELDLVANALLGSLYTRFGLTAPAPVVSTAPAASDAAAQTAAEADVADLPHA